MEAGGSVRVSKGVARSCAVAGVVLALVAPPAFGGGSDQARCVGANTRAIHASVREMVRAVVCLVNEQRSERGLPTLQVSWRLNRVAQSWTDYMVRTHRFIEGDFGASMSRAGYNWQLAGSVVAAGFRTPRAVVNGWMASTAHCEIILNPAFRNVGTGESPRRAAGGSRGRATWTQDFGLTFGQSPASYDTAPELGCPYR